MTGTAKKTDPKLWEQVKKQVTKSSKGGKPGQWSARKAQLATSEYKKEGGSYEGGKSKDNHLKQWTDEEWGTKSGQESGETGERYLPKKARAKLSDEEYDRSTRKKRADSAEGRQHSSQPQDVARKAASARRTGGAKSKGDASTTKAELMRQAKAKGVAGRSKMSKGELEQALRR